MPAQTAISPRAYGSFSFVFLSLTLRIVEQDPLGLLLT